jgi:hypothetical protein
MPDATGRLTHPLVGSWRLLRWVAVADDGTESFPMGEHPEGLLVYASDGTMIGMMGRGGRPRFASDDLTGGTDAERVSAFESFIAYGGSFEVDGQTVRHRVVASLFPNWIGTVQRRRWEFDADGRILTLTSPPMAVGDAVRVQRLSWARAGA